MSERNRDHGERKKRDSDIWTIAKVALVVVALGAILELVACRTAKSTDENPVVEIKQ